MKTRVQNKKNKVCIAEPWRVTVIAKRKGLYDTPKPPMLSHIQRKKKKGEKMILSVLAYDRLHGT